MVIGPGAKNSWMIGNNNVVLNPTQYQYIYLYALFCVCRYFYKEAKSYYEGSKVTSIFEQEDESSPLLKLKDHISLHLYISHPTCGDYAYYEQEM